MAISKSQKMSSGGKRALTISAGGGCEFRNFQPPVRDCISPPVRETREQKKPREYTALRTVTDYNLISTRELSDENVQFIYR